MTKKQEQAPTISKQDDRKLDEIWRNIKPGKTAPPAKRTPPRGKSGKKGA